MEETSTLLQEKTRAAAAPRKPKKGAVSSPLNDDDVDMINSRREEIRLGFSNLFGLEFRLVVA